MIVPSLRRRSIAMALLVTAAMAAGAQTPDSASAHTAPPAYRNRLLGVYDMRTGDPIEGAEVSDVLARNTALTTATGTVSLAFLPDGGAMIRIRKVGYAVETMVVAISPVDTVPLTVLLSPAQTLPTVVTNESGITYKSAGMRGFEERRRAPAGGTFIAEADLRKNDDKTTLANVLRRVPGLQIVCGAAGGGRTGECWGVGRRSASKYAILGGQCAVDLYVNGAPMIDNDLNKFQLTEIGGVEYYAGAAVPALYNQTGSTCGVLLLWLRED
jgi:hypothetical protein